MVRRRCSTGAADGRPARLLVASVVGLAVGVRRRLPAALLRAPDAPGRGRARGTRPTAARATLTAAERWLTPTGPRARRLRLRRRRVHGRPHRARPAVACGPAAARLRRVRLRRRRAGQPVRLRPASVLEIPETQFHLSVLVVLLFCAQSLVQTLQFSDHARAAWVFGTLPEANPLGLQMGAQQALAAARARPAPRRAGRRAGVPDAGARRRDPRAVLVRRVRAHDAAGRAGLPPAAVLAPERRLRGGRALHARSLASVPAGVLALLVQIVAFTSRAARRRGLASGLIVAERPRRPPRRLGLRPPPPSPPAHAPERARPGPARSPASPA